MNRTLLRLLFAFLLAAPAVAQYSARTDTAIIRYPAQVPAMGNAGSCYTDSAFGSTICAVTDETTYQGWSFDTTNYSGVNAWAPDDTSFYFFDPGGAVWTVAFDPSAGTVQSLTRNGLKDFNRAEWCFNQPQTVIGTPAYPLLEQIVNGKESTIWDVRQTYHASPIPYADDVSASSDCTRYALVAWPAQNQGQFFGVWDAIHHGYTYVNTQTLTVTGQWGSSGKLLNHTQWPLDPFYIHHAWMSRNGQWAELSANVFWKIGTLDAYAFPQSGGTEGCMGNGGHDAMGYSAYYDTCSAASGLKNYLPDFFVNQTLGLWGLTKGLISAVMSQYSDYGWDYHISANESRGPKGLPFDSDPIVISSEYISNPQGIGAEPVALSPYMNEIDGLCTNCTVPTVWRFAHTFHNYPPALCCGPTGNVSPDGQWFIFTSNWACTRGLDSQGNCRTDVFIVNLQNARASRLAQTAP